MDVKFLLGMLSMAALVAAAWACWVKILRPMRAIVEVRDGLGELNGQLKDSKLMIAGFLKAAQVLVVEVAKHRQLTERMADILLAPPDRMTIADQVSVQNEEKASRVYESQMAEQNADRVYGSKTGQDESDATSIEEAFKSLTGMDLGGGNNPAY